ncbi:Oxygen tolerance [Pedobacter westerhofensis]|uniref:Oxygen tolerance n=1 Tax=Pedobacter westerhofensis TaxID=425512 RepID=A0A521CQU4_9SPHI|nr:BatD family protein [Pedobacter westerhofensis]SMO61131.1 Oxygen tolerance [Pedobacter westerhofensis]
MKTRYYITLLLLLCTNFLFAQDARFTASVSSTQVGTGEQFEVTFSVNGNGDRFTPPDFNGFQVLSGPNVSNSITSINGNTTVSNAYSYILAAVKEGTITIGTASMVVNGRRLQTSPIRMTVVKGQPVQQNNQAQNAPDNSIAEEAPADLSKSLFIRAVADQTTVYQGQQIVLTYRLYTRVGIVDSRLDKLPDLTGFWSQEVKDNQQQAQWRVETYKGQKYNVADVRQSILFAEHSGNITIDPFEMTFIARVTAPARDIMDQFFGSYKDVKYAVKSPPLVIHVKPLPENGKPAGFTGAVGNFIMSTDVDKTELKANESLTYKVKVSGSGNIKLLKDLNVNFPPDFEKYDPKITDTVTESTKGVSGSRLYTFLVIPRHQGDFKIDPLKFSYFNPSTGRYVVLPGKTFSIKVNRGTAESNVTAFSAVNKEDVKVLDKDIRYIKTGEPGLSRKGEGFYSSPWYFLLLAAGPLACVAAFIYRNRERRNNSDVVKVKSRKAGKVAARHLAIAEKLLGNRNEFYEAIFKGLYGYLSDKLNISMADLNRETISSALNNRMIDQNLVAQLLETLDICEMARYSPVTSMSEQEVLEKAKTIINRIEDEI